MEISIEFQPPRRVAGLVHSGPFNQLGVTWKKLGPIAGAAGLFGPGVETISVFLGEQQAFAGVTLRALASAPAGLEERTIPGGKFATFCHYGPYEGLHDSWNAFMEELKKPGYRTTSGPCFEIYLNDCTQVPAEKLETLLCVSVE